MERGNNMFKFLKNLFQNGYKQDSSQGIEQSTHTTNKNTSEMTQLPTTQTIDETTSSISFAVPVINDPTKREFDSEYKLKSDNENVIRLNQLQPKGCSKKVAEFVPVAGVTKDNREEGALKFIRGKNRSLELIKDPNNPYDKNAIKVHGHCKDEDDNDFSTFLGFVPAKNAKSLAKLEPLKATVKMMYYPVNSETIGIRMDVWSKANKRKKVEEKPYEKMKIPSNPVRRNTEGRDLEKKGYIDNAIEFYELNLKEQFDGNFPYDRLAIIYRKRKQYNEEIRVLERAISVFEDLEKSSPRSDVNPKLEKFKERLDRAKELRNK